MAVAPLGEVADEDALESDLPQVRVDLYRGLKVTTPLEEWKQYALTHGMKPCVLCGEPVGGRCPPCDRVICYACTVPVKIAKSEGNVEGRIAWRCKQCAAELILSGQGEPT